MGRSRKPPERCVYVNVFHPDAFERQIDADEYENKMLSTVGAITWGVQVGDRSPRLVTVEVKHGVARQTATKLLRQIADALDRSSESIMAAHDYASGDYDLQKQAFIDDWACMEGLGGETPEAL